MKKNMGSIDRVIRVVLAIVGIALVGTQVITGVWAVVVALVAAVFLGTSSVGFCPLYKVFNMSTKGQHDQHQHA